MCFFETRGGLVARPWTVDHLDPLLDRLCRRVAEGC